MEASGRIRMGGISNFTKVSKELRDLGVKIIGTLHHPEQRRRMTSISHPERRSL
jgi:hypothetical protein